VHLLIEEGYLFILTGSSARKIKRGSANLLGGRARERRLYPFTTYELKNYSLDKIINFGSLPSIYFSSNPEEDLNSYAGTYLKEEIHSEGLVRNLPYFSRFLEIAAISNTEQINYSSIASDTGVTAKTIKGYFEILEDTLIGEILYPYTKTKKRKPVSIPKFYFFDVGVANILASRFKIEKKSELFGKCFEHFIFCEIRAYLSYSNDRRKLTYWRSTTMYEVDFIIGDDIAIEVKGTELVTSKHMKGLSAFAEEKIGFKKLIIVSLDSHPRVVNSNIEIIPYRIFLENLWKGEY
jgi:predicted AAA+ superfamily ATPase